MNDLDTNIMVIVDGDPSKMLSVELEGNDLRIPSIHGAVLIDHMGWLAGNLITMFETEQTKSEKKDLLSK